MSIESDLAHALEGWGASAVEIGAWSGRALVDELEQLEADRSGEPVLVRKTVVRLPRAAFVDATGASTITRGDTVTIDGRDYVVADQRLGGADGMYGGSEIDGRELHLVVRRA